MQFFKALSSRPPSLVLSTKTLIIMRLIVFLTVVASFQASAAGAQLVTISRKNASLLTIFQDIRQQTGYSFVFNQAWLSQTKPVTVEVKNAQLKDALDIAFQDQPFTYDITDKIISLKERAKPMSTGNTIEDPDPVINVHGKVVGEDGKPLEGVTVMVKGGTQMAKTDGNGEFTLHGASVKAILVFTSVNTEFHEYKINGKSEVQVSLKKKTTEMGQVSVELSNGYERFNRERVTGAFSYMDSSLIDREVSTNIIDKARNNMTGIFSPPNTPITTANFFSANPSSRGIGITIRGVTTLSNLVTMDPLIIVDGYPYIGDINNINPNDVESITELKDAAAASIWGAQAGNGVLVLTTKKGRLNKGLLVDFTTNLTVTNKPNPFKNPDYLGTNNFINVEDTLFNLGYYDGTLLNTATESGLTPVVQILVNQKNGLISAAQAQGQIDALRANDVRNDIMKYVEQKAINQQYSIGMRGGNEQMDYSIRFGYDNNRGSLIRNASSRMTVNINTTFRPVKNLEITGALLYAQSELINDNNVTFGYPYAKLKNPDGSAASITTSTYNESYIDSLQKLGFLDWHYKPLDEIKYGNNTTKTNDWLFKVGAKYHIFPFLSAELQYENEQQIVVNSQLYNDSTYYARNLINQFTQYDPSTQTFTYNFPVGGILNASNLTWSNYTYRGQLSFSKDILSSQHVTAIVGAEQRQLTTSQNSSTSYGYDPNLGTNNNILNYNTSYPINPGGYSLLPSPAAAGGAGQTLRYLSYYGNAAYTYKQRYTLSASAREDGANIFGVNINKKFSPLWSTGVSWELSRENFYHLDFIPYLKIRATYGFNGNVYNGSAYVTGSYNTAGTTGVVAINGLNAPNQNLSWEKVKNINLGLDFTTKTSFIYGSADFYLKQGQDLVEPISLPPSVGFDSYYGNAASTKTKGIELTLNSNIIDRKFKWHIALIGNFISDKVTRWDVPITNSTFQTNGGLVAIKGKPLYSVFGYKWAGLDATNGDPQGYLNGKVSKDYTSIINNYQPDSLRFVGSARPTKWGSLRNDFSYAGFTISFMLTYKFGYYFRRPSITGNLSDALAGDGLDFNKRWQKPGDEKTTAVPSEVYPSNTNRATFYTYSTALVTKGDLIRFQDIRLSYNLTQIAKNSRFSGIEVYSYANNLGLLWKANKWHLDPDSYAPAPISISFGVKASFK